jgi:hypothetical protein
MDAAILLVTKGVAALVKVAVAGCAHCRRCGGMFACLLLVQITHMLLCMHAAVDTNTAQTAHPFDMIRTRLQ